MTPSGQKPRMLAGEPCLAHDPELVADRRRAQALLARFNAAAPEDDAGRAAALAALLGGLGAGAAVIPPFRCNCGANVTIGDGVWLGGGVIVCPGVSIGENSVVGAGSVVTRRLKANVVAAGNPGRVLRPC